MQWSTALTSVYQIQQMRVVSRAQKVSVVRKFVAVLTLYLTITTCSYLEKEAF